MPILPNAALALLLASPTASTDEPAAPDFFAAALCQPPYSMDNATALYEAAEKLAKPDTSNLGAATYRLPAPISRDGFVASDAVFAGSAVGVLVDGEVAARLAERYGLVAETSHLLGASSLGFSRPLPDEQQGMKDLGLISIVARQSPAMPGRTLLACEFVSNEDREAMEELEKSSR